MAESTVGWFVVREKYCPLAKKSTAVNDPIVTDEKAVRARHACCVCVLCSAYQQKGEGLRWLSTSTDASSFFTWLRMVDSLGPWITSASTSTCNVHHQTILYHIAPEIRYRDAWAHPFHGLKDEQLRMLPLQTQWLKYTQICHSSFYFAQTNDKA